MLPRLEGRLDCTCCFYQTAFNSKQHLTKLFIENSRLSESLELTCQRHV
uniref:Uncharacterized protein n=1 Tax=Arundo donax TaxID=35708 RepID=A0A0A8Z2H0_ARUDO